MESSRDKPLGIAELVRLAGRTLDGMGLVWLEGEVSQVSRPTSGHLYFALKDRECVLSAVMWQRDAQRVRFAIEPGQRLRVRGRLGVYDRDGKMQLYADFAEPAGLGDAALALEQLKQKLAAEGLFAPEKKRPLPKFPRRIGVVTSASGAAVHDIIMTVQRRFPTPILIADAQVQGPLAPAQLVNGMAMVVRAGIDVLIIGRGGGAATDLTAFNHERVVRTIARCPVPVISAVGHEIDLSLADLAADARASTPTAAAELAVPDGRALAAELTKDRRRIDREMRHVLARAAQDLDRAEDALHARGQRKLATSRAQLDKLAHRLAELHPRARLLAHRTALADLERRLAAHGVIATARRELDGLANRRDTAIHKVLAASAREVETLANRRDAAMRRLLEQRRSELGRLGAQMAALSPLAVLDRGYAVAMKGPLAVRSSSEVAPGDRLTVRLHEGAIDVEVV